MKNVKVSSTFSAKFIFTLLVGIIAGIYLFTSHPNEAAESLGEGLSAIDLAEDHAKDTHTFDTPTLATESNGKEQALLEQPNEGMMRADFENLAQYVQSRLPVTAEFKKLRPQEVHTVPELIQKAGEDLGLIAQALNDNPHLANSALEFYTTCFERSDLPDQVRALCLANHRRLRIEHSDRIQWTEKELESTTAEVRGLADHIPL